MTYEHLSPRSQVVAGQGVAERVEYLIEIPYLPVQPLDQVETWLRDAISIHVDRPLKPITSAPALTVFLDAFQRWFPLRRTSDLCDDQSLRKALVRRTGGTTRNMLDVLIRLGAFAIYNAEERITYEVWREYFSRAEYA